MKDESHSDCILVGGGLANSLIALALRHSRPDLKIKIIERDGRIGGNHTWSFHSADLDIAGHAFLRPLVVRSWDSQEVRFPRHTRVLSTRYNSISSSRLHDAVCSAFGERVLFNTNVVEVTASHVTLPGGQRLTASCVIDGRGALEGHAWQVGYQKFFGLEVELERPSGLKRPVIMDATVPQIDGYRFVYTLPFDDRRLLIEDTYYSDRAGLDKPALEERVKAYASAKGWRIERILRQEAGVLPIILSGNIEGLWLDAFDSGVPRAGVRAIMFHPTTGYSLPDAARLARRLSRLDNLASAEVARMVREQSLSAWETRSFYRMLNRLLFIAAKPHERLAVMQRFYTLPEATIRRFYACESTFFDKARILTGKPPVSFFRALQCINEKS